MLIEIFCRKLIVSDVVLVFLDHLKPKIFFSGQPQRSIQSATPFQMSGPLLNIIPVHKRTTNNQLKPIPILPIFGKVFEKIIFNKIYHFLLEERLLNPYQSGFRPSESCLNQLLAITHEIFQTIGCNPPLQVRSVFLDISKAFGKMWHEGLLYKLKSMGISGELHNLLENCLSSRFQMVILNGQNSSWRPVLAGSHSVQYWVHFFSCLY